MDDRQFKILLDQLGYAFEGYRRVRKGVKKRIRRHMRDLGCRDVAAYRAHITASPADREDCVCRMAVSISRFMRDRPLWEALRDVHLPELHRHFGPRLHAWCAGCACGEEAYTLAMMHGEMAAPMAGGLAIHATDLNPAVLARARAGVYPASSLRELPDDLRQRYFRPLRGGRRCRLATDLLPPIRWACHDLAWERPAQAFHLILVRNSILTYCDTPRRTRIMERVVKNLLPQGLLVIGFGEMLPAGLPDLVPVAHAPPFVFRRPADDARIQGR